jgi:hypothetical protein
MGGLLFSPNDADPDQPDIPDTAGLFGVVERSRRRTIKDLDGVGRYDG